MQGERARLIPTSGIGNDTEAEQRATSALLAVIGAVRPLSQALLSPLGASRAERAVVETFTEVPLPAPDGRTVRPDGLVNVSYGTRQPWSALVEVKTGTNPLDADQVNLYWELAREHDHDCVITISNEISPAPGVHPTVGLKVRSNSRVPVHHFSWTRILSEAVMQKVHHGVDDPEQAWILGELIRYLEHPASGALELSDMGPSWVAVRDGARASTLAKRDDAVEDIARRWDQLLQYAALVLGSEIGSDVHGVIPRRHRDDPSLRTKELVDELCDTGLLTGSLRVPRTVGDLDITADLRAQTITVSTRIEGPTDKGARGTVSWLTRQLADAPEHLEIEAVPRNARAGTVALLDAAREDPLVLLDEDRRKPARFVLTDRCDMGLGRRAGRKPGFIESVLAAIKGFYETALQEIVPYQERAPRLRAPSGTTRADETGQSASSEIDLRPEEVDPRLADQLRKFAPVARRSAPTDTEHTGTAGPGERQSTDDVELAERPSRRAPDTDERPSHHESGADEIWIVDEG